MKWFTRSRDLFPCCSRVTDPQTEAQPIKCVCYPDGFSSGDCKSTVCYPIHLFSHMTNISKDMYLTEKSSPKDKLFLSTSCEKWFPLERSLQYMLFMCMKREDSLFPVTSGISMRSAAWENSSWFTWSLSKPSPRKSGWLYLLCSRRPKRKFKRY